MARTARNKMDMDPMEIKIKMIRAGVAQSELARKLGKTHVAVNRVIHGLSVSHPIRQAIADAIGMDIKRIWPSTYLHGGPRKPGRPKAA